MANLGVLLDLTTHINSEATGVQLWRQGNQIARTCWPKPGLNSQSAGGRKPIRATWTSGFPCQCAFWAPMHQFKESQRHSYELHLRQRQNVPQIRKTVEQWVQNTVWFNDLTEIIIKKTSFCCSSCKFCCSCNYGGRESLDSIPGSFAVLPYVPGYGQDTRFYSLTKILIFPLLFACFNYRFSCL